MILRMIRRSNGQQPAGHDPAIKEQVVCLLKEATLCYTSQEIGDCVHFRMIPAVFIDTAISYLDREAGLENVTMEDFIEAIGEARPDCEDIFATDAGREWLNSAQVRLGQAYATHSIRRLFLRR